MSEIHPFISRESTSFRTIDSKNPTILSIYQFFLLEYGRQILIQGMFHGDSKEYTLFNRELFDRQKNEPPEVQSFQIFQQSYFNDKQFSGIYWIDEYLSSDENKAKVFIFKKTRGEMQGIIKNLNELGILSTTSSTFVNPEENLFVISEFFHNILGNKEQAINSIMADTWISESLGFQSKDGHTLEQVRTAEDNQFNKMNEREDLRKKLSLDKIVFLGSMFGSNLMAVIITEKGGMEKIEYIIKKPFDLLHARAKFGMFLDAYVPSKKIRLKMIEYSKPGAEYITYKYKTIGGVKTKVRVVHHIYELLPPGHYNDDGSYIHDYYKDGIPNRDLVHPENDLTIREFYRDIIMCGNMHLQQHYSASDQNKYKFDWFEGDFAILWEESTKTAFERARRLANYEGKRYDTYKEFVHSLNNLNFGNPLYNLGLTEAMAKKIMVAHGLTWFDQDNGGWYGSPTQIANEYLFPQAEKLWSDLNRPKEVLDHSSLLSFITAFKHLHQHSGMIHLLFDPNKIFEQGQPWYPKKQEFLDRGLVRYEGEGENRRLYWNYPGDTSQKFGEYQYFSYDFFTGLINNELLYDYWHKLGVDEYGYERLDIFGPRIEQPLGLPPNFMEDYCDIILILFDNAHSS